MYFDGQNLEALKQKEEDTLLSVLQTYGDIEITEFAGANVLQVGKYKFFASEPNKYLAITGADSDSNEVLLDIYAKCDGTIK